MAESQTGGVGPMPRAGATVSAGQRIATIARRWPIIVIVMLLVTAVGVAASQATKQSTDYEATATVALVYSPAMEALNGRPRSDELDRTLANELAVATSDSVLADVKAKLGYSPGTSAVDPVEGSDLLLFTGRSGEPDTAAAIANTWAAIFIEQTSNDEVTSVESALELAQARYTQLEADRAAVVEPFNLLQDQLDGTVDPDERTKLIRQIDREATDTQTAILKIDSELRSLATDLAALQVGLDLAKQGTVELSRQAKAPAEISSSPEAALIASLLAAGLLLGVVIAAALTSIDNRVDSEADLEALGVAVLGTIPADQKSGDADRPMAVQSRPTSEIADAYHLVRTATQISGGVSVAVVGAGPAVGRTTTAVNLASAFSVAGISACVVDADLRSPQIHGLFGVDQGPGLSDVLAGATSASDAAVTWEKWQFAFAALPSGGDLHDPISLLSSPDFRENQRNMLAQVDVVVYDTSSLSEGSDALVIAAAADVTILVVRKGRSRADVERATALVRRSGGALLGVVFIDDKKTISKHTSQFAAVRSAAFATDDLISPVAAL